MYCPVCNNYCSDNESFCSQCGYALRKSPAPAKAAEDTGINFGRANALKDVQIDNSRTDNSVHNVYDNSVHNIHYDQRVIYERQKSQEEITAENEGAFMQTILSYLEDGILDQNEYVNLKILARQKGISDIRAQQLINEIRSNVALKNNGTNNSFIADRTVREIKAALCFGNCEIIKSKFPAIKQLADNIHNNDIQFYSNMLYASLNPESCVVELMNTPLDNYWQQFWSCIAFLKCGKPESAAAIMSRLGGYGFPIGNLSLLMAISSLAEYRKYPTQNFYALQVVENLEDANGSGISEQLIPLWLATQQAASNHPQIEDLFRFYYEVTLKEMCTMVPPELPQAAMKVPTIPQIDPQNIQLSQMQGFNPLKAAEQLMTGTLQMPGIPPIEVVPQNIDLNIGAQLQKDKEEIIRKIKQNNNGDFWI